MSTFGRRARHLRDAYPIATEVAVLVFALVAVRGLTDVTFAYLLPLLPAVEGPPSPLIWGPVISVATFALFAGIYAGVRNLDVGLAVPSRADWRWVAMAVVVPTAFVLGLALVATLFGTTYSELTGSASSSAASLDLFLATGVGWALLFGVVMALVYHVIVQETFEAVLEPAPAALATVLFGAVVLADDGRFTVASGRGTLAFVVLALVAFAVLTAGLRYGERPWLQALAALPLAVLVGSLVVSWVLYAPSVPAALEIGITIALLGLTAESYRRTDSLWLSMLAFATYAVATRAVPYVLGAGPPGGL